MWTYCQSSGELSRNGVFVGKGYSGREAGLNNPAMEADEGVGPIPAGRWVIGAVFDHPRLGRCVMHLMPDAFDPHGRAAFLIHGDNAQMNHTASHGCIILAHLIRLQIAASPDRALTVIA